MKRSNPTYQCENEIEIGAVPHCRNQSNTVKITVEEALDQIAQGTSFSGTPVHETIRQIRSLDPDSPRCKELKLSLPALVFAGHSSQNSKEEIERSPSGLICADIDDLPPEKIEETRRRLVEDPHTLACFLSPRGSGFKTLHKIPSPEKSWGENYLQVEAYYRETHGLVIDKSCKNSNRLCFYSYDPDIYINWKAPALPETEISPGRTTSGPKESERDSNESLERAKCLLDIVPPIVGDHVEWIRFCGSVSNLLQESGHSHDVALELLTEKWPEPENRKQLSALVKDRRDTPIGCAEGIAKRLNPDGYTDYKARFLDPWKHWKDYVYDSVSDEIVNTQSLVARTRKGFDLKYSKNMPTVIKEKGTETVAPSVYTIQRCPEVAGKEYAPSEARPTFTHPNGENMLNIYHPIAYHDKPDPKRVESARTLLTNHIAHMFADHNEASTLLEYLAWCVQNPGVLKPWMIILYGVQGDGKSWFRELMEAALGEDNVGVLQSSNLEDQFASPAYGKCLTFIEELKLDNVRKYDTLERMKSLIGNRRVSLREMRRAPREVRATANYLAATNHSDSLPVSDNERRFCVLTSQWVNRKRELRKWVEKNPDYYPTLYQVVRENPAAMREALLTHEVSMKFRDTHEAPRTKGTLRMIDEAVSAGAVELGEWISDWESTWINDQFVVLKALKEKHSDETNTHYRSTSGVTPQKMPPTKKLSRYFEELGYTSKEQRSIRISRGMDNKKGNITIYLKPEADPDAAFESYKTREAVKPVEQN